MGVWTRWSRRILDWVAAPLSLASVPKEMGRWKRLCSADTILVSSLSQHQVSEHDGDMSPTTGVTTCVSGLDRGSFFDARR
jgi:hypothetical protein